MQYFGVAGRKRSSCSRPFKVADNATISPRKNLADYQRCANLPRRLVSFPANRRANSHGDGCGERTGTAEVFTNTSNVTTRARDKYSTAGRSKNVVIRQYECKTSGENYHAMCNFSSQLFLLSFFLRLDGNDGPGFGRPGWFHKR